MRLLIIFLLVPLFGFPQHGLKKLIIPGGYSGQPAPTAPRDYYISEAGTGNGLTSGAPGPVSLLENAQIISGDEIYFNRGDEFYVGDITISTVDGVLITAFGSGDDPILWGSDYIGDETFTSDGEGNYYLSLPDAKWLYESLTVMKQGQSGWLTVTSAGTNTRAINSAGATYVEGLSSSIVGAKMYAKEYPFRLTGAIPVTGYNPATDIISFVGPISGVAVGMPVFLTGQKQFLTATNEWFYDAVADRIYLRGSDPAGRNLRVGLKDAAFNLVDADNVTISQLEFRHYQSYAIHVTNSPDFEINNCAFRANRSEAIRIQGNETTNSVMDNLLIYNTGTCAIVLGAIQTSSITNSIIDSVGLQLNLGFPFSGHATGGTAITILPEGTETLKTPNTVTIDHNTMTNLGYQGVQLWGPNHQITNNLIHDFCMKWSDGGGVHIYNLVVLGISTEDVLVQNNIIYNGIGNNDGIASGSTSVVWPGIYFDAGVNDCTADNNVVYNTGQYAMYCNFWTTRHIITDNIFLSDKYALLIQENTTPHASYPFTDTEDCIVTGNVFSVKSSTARCMAIIQWNGDTSWDPFLTIDTNHYVQPYSTNVVHRSTNGTSFTNQTFAAWQTYTGGEASGTSMTFWTSSPDADDILVETNPADTPDSFNVPAGYKNYDNTSFSNPVSIPAWYGLMYFQKP